MARFRLILAFFALATLAAGVIAVAYFWEKVVKPQQIVVTKIDERKHRKGGPDIELPDLGKREFDAAMALVKEGELLGARDRLYYLLKFFPESKTVAEAKRIIGEINLDLLLSGIPMEGKTEYVVKSGDALVSIARRNKCTVDYILRANANTSPVIHPGDRLTVTDLDFTVVVDASDKALRVESKGRLFKEYPIVELNIPHSVKPPVSTTVTEKVAWYGDRSVNFTQVEYLQAKKWLKSGKLGLMIRAYETPGLRAEPVAKDRSQKVDKNAAATPRETEAPVGVLMDPADMDELFTIVRGDIPLKFIN
ncbi:MAG: LysM peptidoglycan-binding domain-containing protein [Verrucomicrobiales bacterium]|mgnify:CR=1 FL=1|nr:LysM peptidoglycan-binding domain-containing protein [Verrucomicrobiae bacterium]MCP5554357.1 LysM peptidoglycan-binding domain-containing protein [Akkermansiaceae bacterium]HRX54710.1 LysM peptidoglycan-binding domain-containing protein [Verrucomicrobiales bacterium]